MHTKEERLAASSVIEQQYQYDVGAMFDKDEGQPSPISDEEYSAAIKLILSDIDEWREIEQESRDNAVSREAGFQVYSWMEFLKEYTTLFISSDCSYS